MKVTLKNYTPLDIAIDAIRTCWDSGCKKDSYYENGNYIIGNQDRALLNRIIHQHKHHSTIEHLHFNFYIEGISRTSLQELVRHRIASYSVESTRYTLKKHLRKEEEFNSLRDLDRASKYVVLTKDMDINVKILDNLNNLLELVKLDKSNDTIKYALPEAFRTNLAFSINMRSLMNFIELRTSKAALKEIRILAMKIFQSLPYIYKEVFFPELLKSELYAEMKEENINEINNIIKEIEKGDK
ncbi:TPA: FAD-dependent thymidylate synthase [Campylobacter coli]